MHICERDNMHVEDETVATMITLGRAPTDTEKGETLFTAIFANEAFGEITKTMADIPAFKNLFLLRLTSMLKEIDSEAFMGSAVEGAIVPEGCTAIGSRAFVDCQI